MSTILSNWRDFCYHQHNVVCNQKYDDMPYSFHLDKVAKQGVKFLKLLEDEWYGDVHISVVVMYALYGHDLIEDARMTYNDIYIEATRGLQNTNAVRRVAEIIYKVTDEKGKNRAERKNEKYYLDLKSDKLAVFVKLSDIAANTLYSKLCGSDMYHKYKLEFINVKDKLYLPEYEELFKYIENI